MVELAIKEHFPAFVSGGMCLFAITFLGFSEEPRKVVVLEAGETREQIFLDGEPSRVHFDASGLRVLSGESEHFATLPRFILYSASLHDPENGVGYPSTEKLEEWELPNEEIYPVQIREKTDPSIEGFSVIGQQSRDLPWRVIKAMWDGDALHVKHCSGHLEVRRVYWENVEDGLGPLEGLESWSLRDSVLRYIRDDAVENDDLIPGEIVNCLIDGCFTFLSQRAEPPRPADCVTKIRDSLIHVSPQPHDGSPGKEWRNRQIKMGEDGIGRVPGMLFKWEEGGGTVVMTNCVVRIDGISVNGKDDMEFPPGEYENVTLVWLGGGKYPRPVPDGVRIETSIEVWETAREDWLAKLPQNHPAYEHYEVELRNEG